MNVSIRAVYAVWMREVTVYRRIYKSTIVASMFDPMIYLLAMGFGLGAYLAGFEGRSYAEFIAPGLIASAAMMAASAEVTWNTFVRVHQERVFEAMLATPASVEDIVLGECVWAATRSTIYAAVMLLVVAAFGLVDSPLAVLVLPVAFLGGLLFAFVGMAYTSKLVAIDQVLFFYTLFITPMFLASGIFFPLEGLPEAFQKAAWFMPLRHLVLVMRDLTWGTVGLSTLADLAWLLVAVFLLAWIPMKTMRRLLIR
ncbi:MAG: ABC transporter permease [Methanobacteriota archaeon]